METQTPTVLLRVTFNPLISTYLMLIGQAHDMELISIKFRFLILSQREKLSNQNTENTNDTVTLQEINQTLQKIYELLQQKSKIN